MLWLLLAVGAVIFFAIAYRRLFSEKTVRPVFDRAALEPIPKYAEYLTAYINTDNTFQKNIKLIISLCTRFVQKRDTLDQSLLEHFQVTELTYIKFSSVIRSIEDSVALTCYNILVDLKRFDEGEYSSIINRKTVSEESLKKRQAILDEYTSLIDKSANFLDEVLIKIDQLQLEISKISNIDLQDIENMDIIKEIDSLIRNTKLYK